MQTIVKRNKTSKYLLSSLSILTPALLLISPEAKALPSFTRQTGFACSQCHTQSFGPNLTPFGRDFKMGGYTMDGGSGINAKLPPVSGMVLGSFTNTQKNQDPVTLQPGYNKNNNFTFDEASLFYAGRVYGKVGAFSELSYDGYAKALTLGGTDIRFADQMDIGETPVTYGVSLNNSPTIQDLWNTTKWGFPYTGTGVQPAVGSTALIDGGLDSQVGGATAYTMIDNLLYLEAGAYGSFSSNFQKGFGIAPLNRLALASPAPYWRVAVQKDWKGHFFAVGHFGLIANVVPGRDNTYGSDRYSDFGFDATYQYMANPRHIFEAKTTYIYEDQNLSASRQAANDPSTGNTYLNTYKLNFAYTFVQTYGITFGYNKITGSRGPIFQDGIDVGQNSPNSNYYTAELVYVPFGKSNSPISSWLNLRTSLQYIGYSQANGARYSAQDNNTFMINGWLAF